MFASNVSNRSTFANRTGLRGPLSQRERAGVRESAFNRPRRGFDQCMPVIGMCAE